MSNNQLRNQILNDLKQIVIETLAEDDVNIYLFGSWARFEEKQSSDIDVAIEPISSVSPSKWIELREKVEESTIPYQVDIVNLNEVSEELRNNVQKEGVLWKDSTNVSFPLKKH
ncbi:nucleotidyltransferase domain-containing protein [Bacillus tianshenii]|nr:nucleotidyltransferase domain-containing protein [Bacillus tianshenii]